MVQVVGKDQAKVKRITCDSCASILEYINSEVIRAKHYDYGGGCEEYKYILCPCCGDQVEVT